MIYLFITSMGTPSNQWSKTSLHVDPTTVIHPKVIPIELGFSSGEQSGFLLKHLGTHSSILPNI
jgi:hypothetical protein